MFDFRAATVDSLPYDLRDEILLAENLIHKHTEVMYFMIVNAHENQTVVLQQLSC